MIRKILMMVLMIVSTVIYATADTYTHANESSAELGYSA